MLIFNYAYARVSLCVYKHVYFGVHSVQKWALGALELEVLGGCEVL